MNLQVDITYPDLPLPRLDYSGSPRNATLTNKPEDLAINRRSRFQRSYSMLSVEWVLTDAQFAALKAFVAEDLGNGTAGFKMELRYPKNSELKWWEVRLDGGYMAAHEDGMWQVQGVLELMNPVAF